MAKKVSGSLKLGEIHKKYNKGIELSDSNAEEIRKKKENLLNKIAWGLLIIGLFTLGVAVFITIFLWCHIPASQNEVQQTLGKKMHLDKTNFDISPNTEGAKIRAMKLFSNINLDQQQEDNYCYEESCKIHCNRTEELYYDIYQAIRVSKCHTIEYLIISNQEFNDYTYLHSNEESNRRDIKLNLGEIILFSPNISSANTALFEIPLFNLSSIYSMSLIDGIVPYAGAELLENLTSLRYLTMIIKIDEKSSNFFNPVQNSLKNLIFNAYLRLSGNESFFGTAKMKNIVSLDLSMNYIEGRLNMTFFKNVNPHLRYLRMQQCRLTSIEADAFEEFNNLVLLDLSRNLLTTLSAEPLKPLLITSEKLLIDLRSNTWNCNCELVPFLITYFAFNSKFFEGNYCSKPENMQGLPWHELYNLEETCINTSADKLTRGLDLSVETQGSDSDSSSTYEYDDKVLQNGTESSTKTDEAYMKTEISAATYFPPADYKFELTLQKDNTVLVQIINCPRSINANVIWFPEWNEERLNNNALDYKCDNYEYPSFVTNVLKEDTTYTFCIMPLGKTTVSPFNCLPFYVPWRELPYDLRVWIPQEYKNLTIFTYCMTLVFALTIGSGLAYWSAKSYPNLFQCSKDKRVKMDLDRTCQVSTIEGSDMEGMKSMSYQKSLPLEAIPSRKVSMASSNGGVSAKNLDRTHSLKLNLMKKRLEICSGCRLDNYEVPNNCKCTYYEEKCGSENSSSKELNSSINMPPPLPQRNSK